MAIKKLLLIFSIFASMQMARGGLSRAQKIKKGIVKPAPLKFNMDVDELKNLETVLNEKYDNALSNNQIRLSSGERQVALGVKQTIKTYNLVLSKDGSENCVVNFTSNETADKCKNISVCDRQIKNCLEKFGANKKMTQNEQKKQSSEDVVNLESLFKEESNEQQVQETQNVAQAQNKKESSEDVVNIANLFKEESEEEVPKTQNKKESSEDVINLGSLFEEKYNSDEYSRPLANKSEDQNLEDANMSRQIQTDSSEENDQENKTNEPLVGGFQPCNESEEDLLHEGLIYLQKYAYLTFEHLYTENITLCSHQFFARSNNINFMLSFDSTQKCSMSLNIEWDPSQNKRKVRKVTVYQDEGDENYGIFARNPVKRIGLEFPDCADYFGTPLYRMSLNNYKNVGNLKKKREEKLAKLSKTKPHIHDKI